MFEIDGFIEDCKAAIRENDARKAVSELVTRAVSDPGQIIRALGEPKKGEVQRIYNTPDLTILNLLWAPRMSLPPHDHRMWAVIGIYSGQEDNVMFRRIDDNRVEAAGDKILREKDVVSLGEKAIHGVTNPLDKVTAALHVYGGDFFGVPRSEWDSETLEEGPYDMERNMRAFEEANERILAGA